MSRIDIFSSFVNVEKVTVLLLPQRPQHVYAQDLARILTEV